MTDSRNVHGLEEYRHQGRYRGNGGDGTDARLRALEVKTAEMQKDINQIKETMITQAMGWRMVALLLAAVIGIDLGIEFIPR